MNVYECRAALHRHDSDLPRTLVGFHANLTGARGIADALWDGMPLAMRLATYYTVDLIQDDGSIETTTYLKATPEMLAAAEWTDADGAKVWIWDAADGTDARVLATMRPGLDLDWDNPHTYTFERPWHMWASIIALEAGKTTVQKIMEGS